MADLGKIKDVSLSMALLAAKAGATVIDSVNLYHTASEDGKIDDAEMQEFHKKIDEIKSLADDVIRVIHEVRGS
jgi:hypothetical protein